MSPWIKRISMFLRASRAVLAVQIAAYPEGVVKIERSAAFAARRAGCRAVEKNGVRRGNELLRRQHVAATALTATDDHAAAAKQASPDSLARALDSPAALRPGVRTTQQKQRTQ